MFQETRTDKEFQEVKNTIKNADVIYKISAIHDLYIKKWENYYLIVLVDTSIIISQAVSWWRQETNPRILEQLIYEKPEDDSNV